MLWVTREFLHLDRVAAPWLIARFVDAEARFMYVPWGEEHLAPDDAVPLALPGAELGPHDSESSTFGKVLRKYEISDPALDRIGRVVQAGIDYVLHGYVPQPEDQDGQIAVGLLTFAEGIMLTRQDDDAILTASMPIYDALYANFSVNAWIRDNDVAIAHDNKDGRGPTVFVETVRKIYNEKMQAPRLNAVA